MKNSVKTNKTGYDVSKLFHILESKAADPVNGTFFHAPRGNNKLGTIPAWNLLPVCTCSPEARRTCAVNGCYAVKNVLCHGYDIEKNNCLNAWTENTVLVKKDLAMFKELMIAYLSKKQPKFFRIHSSGDFDSLEYMQAWYDIISLFPDIHFLAFTKQFDLLRNVPFYKLPNNPIVLSGWTGLVIPEDLRQYYRCAWCDDGIETRIPDNAIECPGNCEQCGLCWQLNKIQRDTYFHKH